MRGGALGSTRSARWRRRGVAFDRLFPTRSTSPVHGLVAERKTRDHATLVRADVHELPVVVQTHTRGIAEQNAHRRYAFQRQRAPGRHRLVKKFSLARINEIRPRSLS